METPPRKCLASPPLPCSLIIEYLTAQGTVKRTVNYKNAKLILGRNEFRDIMLHIETAKLALKYPIVDFELHKKFCKDGKATLRLKDQLLNLMISNAAPNLLLTVLKIISGKFVSAQLKGPKMSLRQRMMSNLPKTFEEISPMTEVEYETVRQKNGNFPLRDRNTNIPGSSPLSSKRKVEKEVESNNVTAKVPRLFSPLTLNKEQKNVLSAVQSGHNVFFTGSAGTGKSFLLKRIIGMLPPDVTCITASTGVAACHIGGTTLHAFASIGSGSANIEQCIKLASKSHSAQQWKKCRHLVIDEISMVDGEFFKKIEIVARCIRGNDKPFGGIQLIMCGDFLQLPPVAKKGEKKTFCFQSSAWDKCVNLNLELKEVKRQDDSEFIKILQSIRLGRCNPEQEERLKETLNNCVEREGIKATRLCTHREDADYINNIQLEKLPSEKHTFVAIDSDPNLTETLNRQTPIPGNLILKKGAQVMLMKNLDISKGLVNGARGVVLSFECVQNFPAVKFACGVTLTMNYEKWTIKSGGGLILHRKQIPLKLAWAFSIHKSQGMTLDCIEVSLSKVFEAGQAYVALSRARNLKSLRILDFSSSCIRSNPEVLRFYFNLKRESEFMGQPTLTRLIR